MNYLTNICQFIFHLSWLIFFVACSTERSYQDDLKEEQNFIESEKPLALWFSEPDSFKRLNSEGSVILHPFYDLKNNEKSLDELEVNYFVTNEQGSPFYYLFNLQSGQLYKKHQFCAHNDIWKKYNASIESPNFTIGLIPRLIGLNKRPQEVWVFGKSNKYESMDHKAKIIGGVIVQRCESYPCKEIGDWKSRLVLLGVDINNSSLKEIDSVESLKKKVDWDYFEAFVQNAWGHSYTGRTFYPVHRITNYIDGKKSLDYVYKKGHLFTDDELSRMKKSCSKLYDYFYEQSFVKEQKGKDFSEVFYQFFKDHKNHYKTCYRYIAPEKVVGDSKMFWFYSFLSPVMYLDELGHYYDCYRKAWIRKDEAKNLKEEEIWRGCSLKEVKNAFTTVSSYLQTLAGSFYPHTRFIEYDNGFGGSHRKVFSWVFDDAKVMQCNLKEYNARDIYPNQLDWENFGFSQEMIEDDEFEVIR